MGKELITLLSIAGSDCSGGAGIQADIHAASLCKVYPLTAITAVTAQNSHGVSATYPVPPECLRQQLEAISSDVTPDAIKIGMIGSIETGKAILTYLESLESGIPVVIDPILAPTAGGKLNPDILTMMQFLKTELFPLATVVTPNYTEAIRFLKKYTPDYPPSHDTLSNIAFEFLYESGAEAIILKGGDLDSDTICDIFVSNSHPGKALPFISKKINCKNLHGTGCCYSSVLSSLLAQGENIENAFLKTSEIVHGIIEQSNFYSLGNSGYGPLNINNYLTK